MIMYTFTQKNILFPLLKSMDPKTLFFLVKKFFGSFKYPTPEIWPL